LQVALNGSYYSKCLRPQPRFILSTMVANDLAASILVMGMGIVPALFECWPYGERFCQIQVPGGSIFGGGQGDHIGRILNNTLAAKEIIFMPNERVRVKTVLN
jgi:hypothetical protein